MSSLSASNASDDNPPRDQAPLIQVSEGLLQSTKQDELYVFKGVPYAQPPVGDLRWREPQPMKAWQGVRRADAFGPHPLQKVIWDDMLFRSEGMSEDCLYLNVWTKSLMETAKLPVLVYFHGGGFFCGDGSEPRYDGAEMARRGIVTVTVNYRLGVFGFLAHPELSQESSHRVSGNYGLMDQSAALAWVRRNIASFGGDPEKVTIAGESAGSVSVSIHMVTPFSRGLFSGAIGQSGSLLGTLPPMPLKQAERLGSTFATTLKATSLTELRQVPAERLLEASLQPGAPHAQPVLDGYYFPEDPEHCFAQGKQARVPLLAGWTSAEVDHNALTGGQPATLEVYRRAVAHLYGGKAPELLALYPASNDEEAAQAATDLASDRFIAHSTWKWLDLHARTGGLPVYRYLFAQLRPAGETRPGQPAPKRLGAPHASDIEYSLGNLDLVKLWKWTPEDHKASAVVSAYFANFIKTGNPNGPGLTHWPVLDPQAPAALVLQAVPRLEPSKVEARHQFLDRVAK